MITRLLYLSLVWLILSLVATLAGGTRLRHGNLVISTGWLAGVLLLGDAWALLTFGLPHEIALFTSLALLFGLFCIRWMRHWNAFGQVTWTTSIMTTVLFIIYSFQVTAFTPLNALSFLLALVFFFIEALALLMALTHTYESLDATCRITWRRRIERLEPRPGYLPMVSLHVPAYNEPPEVVAATLRSLAALDYPNYEVLVVDNNTPDSAAWRALEDISRQMGPRFHFMHLEKWPGYKSGALNFALTQTDPDAEIIGSIDADYQLDPGFLRELVPAFADPRVAFIQTPQDYREYAGDPYLESTYHGYKYFFEVSMPARNEYNAIIFAGTMGLIRKSALQEIGGWDEWCITEDAEASLRMLKLGYQSIYLNRAFGQGLIPFSFDGLKRQRFRWCFGGIQILKKHWEALMPWAHWVDPHNRLSQAQRYFYLTGSLQWFTDLFNLIFASFLVLGGLFSLSGGQITIRPLTASLMILPAVFLLLGLWRFVWVLRHALSLSWLVAVRAMYGFFSLGWVVTLACVQGLIQPKGAFLRTPKAKSSSRMRHALTVTRWETLIGLTCLTVGALAFAVHQEIRTLFLGLLLAWQSSLYLAAPYYSLLSIQEKPARRQVERGAPVLENRAARWALALVSLLLIAAALIQALPRPSSIPAYIRFLPVEIPLIRLLGLDQVPVEERRRSSPLEPTPTPEDSHAFPTPTGTPADPGLARLEPTNRHSAGHRLTLSGNYPGQNSIKGKPEDQLKSSGLPDDRNHRRTGD
jgi:cellulose synthase/poly-beta-1,6-N-acetylglucosamine synthase-like glycosyltransferase